MSPRSKSFCEDEVLDKAMHLFWHRGYTATSIQDLVDELGIQRGSLYHTFGGKRKLFEAAFKRFCYTHLYTNMSMLERGASPKGAIRGFFNGLVERVAKGDMRCGCFLANTMTEWEKHDEETHAMVENARSEFVKTFAKTIKRAQAAGEIPADRDAQGMAAFLDNALRGLAVLVRTGPNPKTVKAIVKQTLVILD